LALLRSALGGREDRGEEDAVDVPRGAGPKRPRYRLHSGEVGLSGRAAAAAPSLFTRAALTIAAAALAWRRVGVPGGSWTSLRIRRLSIWTSCRRQWLSGRLQRTHKEHDLITPKNITTRTPAISSNHRRRICAWRGTARYRLFTSTAQHLALPRTREATPAQTRNTSQIYAAPRPTNAYPARL
jgi:hypothetical protein